MSPQDPAMAPELTPSQVRGMLADGDPMILVDVRDPEEHAVANLPQATLIPLNDLPARLFELQEHADSRVVMMCHHGIRSQNAARYLLEQGFSDVSSMAGGIDAWSRLIDTSVPRY